MPITINNIVFDPEAPLPFSVADTLTPRSAEQTDYILVRVTQPFGRDEKDKLAAAGAKIQRYVPDNTYLCHFPPGSLDQVKALPFVNLTLPYFRDFKIDPALTSLTNRTSLLGLETMHTAANLALPDDSQEVDVIFHDNVTPVDGARQVMDAVQASVPEEAVGEHKVRMWATADAIRKIAALDAVSQIEKVYPSELFNNVARDILGLPAISTPHPFFTGAGEVVAVADTGFDNGKTDATIHPAFLGKVKRLYALGRKNSNDASDPHGHGTHVAGSVLGDGNSTSLGVRVQGTAPGASLVLQSCYVNTGSQLGGLPTSLQSLFNPPYSNDGARIHSNSWGHGRSAGTYNASAHEVDDFVYKNRDCLVLFAAGNDGVDLDADGAVELGSVTAPGTAKNCITVGACENRRPGNPFAPNLAPVSLTWGPDSRWPVSPISNDHQADDPGGMAAFSGRGPTLQKRIKPDVVAPGTFILSAKSRNMPASTATMPTVDSDYRFSRGTSMATPLVAGCTALVREWLAERRATTNPSAALVKAFLINGAIDIPGQYSPSEAPVIPNFSEGFGRINVVAIINQGTSADSLSFLDEATALDSEEKEVHELNIPAGTATLKVTLVWTDPPGAGLQSDLDLIVRDSTGNECHGNKDLNAPEFDRDNNVEQVLWQRPPVGQVSITILAARISLNPQSYALVIRAT